MLELSVAIPYWIGMATVGLCVGRLLSTAVGCLISLTLKRIYTPR